MALTLDDLLTPEDPDAALQFYFTQLYAQGFPTTAWQTGGVIYTLLRAVAAGQVNVLALVRAVAAGGLLDLSTGGWLTLLAKSAYDTDRYLATFAQGSIAVTNNSGSPVTVQPGQLWATDAAGHRYNATNAAPVTIANGASSPIVFKAESPGAAYDLANGTAVSLVTPLPGVSVALAPSGGTWLTVQGTDDESDAALRTRCRTRWATIGIQKTSDAYINLAARPDTGASTKPSKVYVDATNPRGPGTLNVWVAGPAGPLSTADLAAVSSYILARKSECSDVQVANASQVTINITADVYYQQQYTGAIAQAADALTALINAVPLGGTLSYAECVARIVDPDGVYDATGITLNGGTANLTLAANQVAVPGTFTLNAHATP